MSRNALGISIAIILGCFILGSSYYAVQMNKQRPAEKQQLAGIEVQKKTPDVSLEVYSTNLPLEYFEGRVGGTSGKTTYIEKAGFQGEIIPVKAGSQDNNLNDPFEGFSNLPNEYYLDKPYWGDPLDVDTDGIKEQVFYYSTAMNHTPQVVSIVKNGRIIFRAEGPSIKLTPTSTHNGFYIEEYNWNDVPTANTKTTRYIYKDGKFIPVWYRNTYVLEVKSGTAQTL